MLCLLCAVLKVPIHDLLPINHERYPAPDVEK